MWKKKWWHANGFLLILKFSYAWSCRFNLSFEESPDDIDGSEVETDENGRPCFSSIAKGAGSLDKELAASGFSRKDQEDIEKVWWSMSYWMVSARCGYTYICTHTRTRIERERWLLGWLPAFSSLVLLLSYCKWCTIARVLSVILPCSVSSWFSCFFLYPCLAHYLFLCSH